MNVQNLRIGGAVVFWRLAPFSDRKKVAEGLTALGMEKFVPEERTLLSCLRGALAETFQPVEKGTRYVVRPVKNGSPGFAVVEEQPRKEFEDGDDWGKVVAVAKLDEKCGTLSLSPPERYGEVWDKMRKAREFLPLATVSKLLVDVIEHLGGVSLRDSGGVYWLNDDVLDNWTPVADLMEAAALPGGPECHVSALRVVADEQMVRAVGDALTSEITTALSAIENELTDGDITERVCESRLARLAKLSAKVRRYADAFGQPMTMLTDAIQRAGAATAMATINASAAGGPSLFDSLTE